ncbi:MAG: lipoprotein signal peptidase [Gammaproteobacteria bacterium]|nr:lipoprotein signal peptidase [Gammaproteobacteria bacterium]
MLYMLWISVLVIILDQVTKIWADGSLHYGIPIEITFFFNINLAYNTGAAFSFLGNAGGWQRWMFITLAFAVSAMLVQWLRKTQAHERWQAYGLVLIIGGALGNALDRIFYGHVVDFIQFHYAGYAFPTFNVADMSIFCGAMLLIIESFRAERQSKKMES